MRLVTQTSDVLIIGSGGAGLRAAIELFDRGIDVVVVGKCKKREAHTKEAQGGINAALGTMDPEDRWEIHAADTIKDGDFINDPYAVETLCREAPKAIQELVEWGVPFNRESAILQRFFGAARYRRCCFVKDSTGQAILNALVDQVVKRNIRLQSKIYITSLLHRNGRVNGALGLNLATGGLIQFQAKVVLLATGGHSRMFKRCSSHFWENNGDGLKLAYELGATFMDMEMFQFHPTGMVYPEAMEGHLVTEAVRGEGGVLTNANGERFMTKYDPERMELSARDIVARANYMEIAAGRGTPRGGVYLDISHRPRSYLKKRLAAMLKLFEAQGVDISKEKMEVAPTAHYSMGGLKVNHATGETTVPGLFAVGEVTAGVHGANRLGGNSLAEILVFGRLTGAHLVKEVRKSKEFLAIDQTLLHKKMEALRALQSSSKGADPIKTKQRIQQLMGDHVGVIRDETTMQRGLQGLEHFYGLTFKVDPSNPLDLMAVLDVQAMLPVCTMIFKTALLRTESRGAHYRSDYPESVKGWIKNILCRPEPQDQLLLWTEPVPPLPSSIQKHLLEKKPKVHLLE